MSAAACTAVMDRTRGVRGSLRGLRCAPIALQLLAACAGGNAISDRDGQDERDAGDGSDAGGDGGAWHDGGLELPEDHGLSAVFGTSPDDFWVGGEFGAVAHYDGHGWKQYELDTIAPLRGLHGSGPNDVWAVGPHTAWRWDGEEWIEVLREPTQTLLDVWVSPRGEAWIAGHSHRDDRALLRHWNGVEWSTHVLASALTFWAVWGSPEGDVWIAGSQLDGSGLVLRGTAEGVDPAGYVGPSIREIWGTSDDDIWVAAYQGGFQHWDGESWREFAAPEDARVMAAGGIDSEHAWAVGLRGLILRYDGAEWTADESGTDTTLMSVWVAAEDDAWAVGGDATVLHWDGESWLPMDGAGAAEDR